MKTNKTVVFGGIGAALGAVVGGPIGLAVGSAAGVGLAKWIDKRPTVHAKDLSDLYKRGGFAQAAPPRKVKLYSFNKAKIAATNALRKYGKPNNHGWASGQDLPPLEMVARAKQLVPQMLNLSLDVPSDLGAAGDGKFKQNIESGVQLAKGVGELATQDYAGAAIDGVTAVAGFFSANEQENERIEFERRAIEIAQQMLEKIANGEKF